jgi:hypothetical protein
MADDRGGVTADAAGSRLERLRSAGTWGSLFSAQAARSASRSVLSYSDSTTSSKKAD